MESSGSGTRRSGSISCWAPSPVQRGQAPCGELKLKIRGWSSGSPTPCSGQAKRSENVSSSPSTTSTLTRPSASASAVSTESVRRWRRSDFMESRSTTTSIVCLNFLSSVISSSRSRTSPSTFTRVKPSPRSSSKTSLYSPLRSRTTGPRVEQAQVVVDLGDGADRRARVARGRLLVDRDRRREAVDRVDVGLLHHLEELARVGGEALDVPPLTFGVDRVEGQGRLSGAAEAGDADQLVPRQPDGDVLEVVLPRAVNYEFIRGHNLPSLAVRVGSNKCSLFAR